MTRRSSHPPHWTDLTVVNRGRVLDPPYGRCHRFCALSTCVRTWSNQQNHPAASTNRIILLASGRLHHRTDEAAKAVPAIAIVCSFMILSRSRESAGHRLP